MWEAVDLSWQRITMSFELSTAFQLLLWTVRTPSPSARAPRPPAPTGQRAPARPHAPARRQLVGGWGIGKWADGGPAVAQEFTFTSSTDSHNF